MVNSVFQSLILTNPYCITFNKEKCFDIQTSHKSSRDKGKNSSTEVASSNIVIRVHKDIKKCHRKTKYK